MPNTYATCPKCGHIPAVAIGATDACPACGVYMHKWAQIQAEVSTPVTDFEPESGTRRRASQPSLDDNLRWGDEPEPSLLDMLRPPFNWLQLKNPDSIELAVRTLVLVLLAWWGWRIARSDLAEGEMMNNFMHAIVLPIHETGHMIFIPFGEFMTIAGGSFFQVFLPFAIAVAFFLKNRDPFGAAVCLWWTGMSLIDLAPYIYDALHPQLMLLTGTTGEDGPHDWIYLFEQLGGLQHSQRYGRAVQVFGMLVGFVAWAWAVLVLWLAWQKRKGSGDE